MFNYNRMSKKAYIGCGAGFAGVRYDASIPIVNEFKDINEPKYLMFEEKHRLICGMCIICEIYIYIYIYMYRERERDPVYVRIYLEN